MKAYIHELWTHPYTSKVFADLFRKGKRHKENASEIHYLINTAKLCKLMPISLIRPSIGASLQHLQKKCPSFIIQSNVSINTLLCGRSLVDIAANANKSVFIQSPYIVPTGPMKEYLPKNMNSKADWTILTNSVTSTPNVIAFSRLLST